MDTLGIALIVVVVVIATVVAALVHERSQVAAARRMAAYAHERQVYEARKAIIIAQRTAQIEAARARAAGATPRSGATALLDRPASRRTAPATAAPPAGRSDVAVPSSEAIDAFLGGDQERVDAAAAIAEGDADLATRAPRRGWRERRRQRRLDQEQLPAWVRRPLRPGEDPTTPWWVRLRATVGLAVMVAILGGIAAATVGSVFLAAGLVLERFTG